MSERPLWAQIAEDLAGQIRARQLTPGDKVPTEQELAKRYMVNRHTVRRALSALQSRGLVETTQGRGSFVRRQTLVFRIRRRTRFSDNMKHAGASHRHDVRVMETISADAPVARALGLKLGAPVILIERLAYANDTPVGIGRHYFSHARLPHFIDMYKSRQSITLTLRDSGILDYVRAQTTILSRLPTPAECAALELPRHVPLLITRAINNDMLGAPLEYGESRFAADRAELRIDSEDYEARMTSN